MPGIDVRQFCRKALARIGIGGAQRLLSELELRQVLFIDLNHDLGFAGRRERHQFLAGLDDVAGFDAAPDERAVDVGENDRLLEPGLRHAQSGAGLFQRGLGHRVVAAGGTVGLHLESHGAQLAFGDVEIALGVIELPPG